MVKENLEMKTMKAVLKIEKKIAGIYDVLCDLSLKLCHIIKGKSDYYKEPHGTGYYN